MLQTTTVPPTESWIELTVPAGMRGVQGNVPTPRPQTYTMELEPTLFVDEPPCLTECDPDRWNPLRLRREVLTATRPQGVLADRRHHRDGQAAGAQSRAPAADGDSDRSEAFTLEDLGYDAQKPASTYALPSRPDAPGDRRPDARLPVDRRRRELARDARSPASATATASGRSTGGTRAAVLRAQLHAPCSSGSRPSRPRELMPTILALQANGFRSPPEADAAATGR